MDNPPISFDPVIHDLLRTKLVPPRLRPSLVRRQRLLRLLDAGLERKLTIISAPAGFGKTTLVCTWAVERREQCEAPALAWVSLDSGDNDPVRFWRYGIAACQTFDATVGKSALALLHALEQPPFEAVLTRLINDLALLQHKGVLVFEDYHLIAAPQIHEAITFLVDHLPETMHLVIITRNDPWLPLSRWRAHDELNELRVADLRFSAEEMETFLRQTFPVPLMAETLARLEARTEGWAAGLHLLALALKGRQEPELVRQFLDTFTGSHRPILEYLVDDVLGALSDELQLFLLQTSVLSRLTASLCNAVTNRGDSAALLEELERINLFVIPLDAERQWYRYHALFAEAMRHEAQRRLGSAEIRSLSDHASRWYADQGLLADAVEAALTAHSYASAASLIERIAEQRSFDNERHTLRRWIEQLPEVVSQSSAELCFTFARTILYTEDRRSPATFARLQAPLERAEQLWRVAGCPSKCAEVLTFRATAAFWQGNFPQTFTLAHQALESLPDGEIEWRGTCLVYTALEGLFTGKIGIARQVAIEALGLSKAVEDIHGTLAATLILGDICAREASLHQAAHHYRQVLAAVDQVSAGDPRDDRAYVLVGLAMLSYWRDDVQAAEQHAHEALKIGQQLGDVYLRIRSSLILARVQYARGAALQARQRLHDLTAELPGYIWPPLLREIRAYQAWLALEAGDMASVRRWYAAAQPDDNDAHAHAAREQEALTIARLLIAQGQAETALPLLNRWRIDAHANGRTHTELETLILLARTHFSSNNLPQATQLLTEALALAQPEGYVRIFLDEGQPMAAALRAAAGDVQAEPLRTYVRSLLDSFAREQRRQGTLSSPMTQPLLEPLSRQEQRVLRLLAAGLSNPEIAQELVVSVNTIKTQVSSIYRKLNVTSRAEARKAARQLDLL